VARELAETMFQSWQLARSLQQTSIRAREQQVLLLAPEDVRCERHSLFLQVDSKSLISIVETQRSYSYSDFEGQMSMSIASDASSLDSAARRSSTKLCNICSRSLSLQCCLSLWC